jgi:hypothetical protein
MALLAASSENAFTLLARFVDAFDWEWSEDEADRQDLLVAGKDLLDAQGYWEAATLNLRAFTLEALEAKILAKGADVSTTAIQHIPVPGSYVLASPGQLSLNLDEPSLKELIAAINRGHDRRFHRVTSALRKEVSRLNAALAKVLRTEALDRAYIKDLREHFKISDKQRF